MNNTYIIQNKPLKELLDNIDSFITNMTKFSQKHKGYKYNVEVSNNLEDKNYWDAQITIKYEKQEYIEDFKTIPFIKYGFFSIIFF